MTDQEIIGKALTYFTKHRFAFLLVITICFGYTFGKDRALKHNAQDAAAVVTPLTESP
jgi:hypothetical protein